MSLYLRVEAAVAASRARGLPHVVIANLLMQALAFLGVLLIAKLLPPDEFAMVRIAMAYVAVAVILGAGGITAPILRYCADNNFDAFKRRRLLGFGLLNMAKVAWLATLCALVLITMGNRDSRESLVLYSYALQIPALAGASLLVVYLQAVHQFKLLAGYQLAIRGATVLLVSFSTYQFGLQGLLFATLLTANLACLPLLYASRPIWRGQLAVPVDFSRLAIYSLTGMIITTAAQYADLIILDWVGADRKQVAVYSLGTIFFFSASALAGAAQGIATPAFTALIGQPDAFERQLWRWSLALTFAGVIVAGGAVAVAFVLEHRFLGEEYGDLGIFVAILMFRFCLWCTYAIGGAALLGVGAVKQGTWVAAVTFVLTFAIGYPMCAAFGVWGAAWTQVAIAMLLAGLISWLIRYELKAMRLRHEELERSL